MAKMRSLEELEAIIDSGKIPKEMAVIHTDWKDYCLYMLNTNSDPIRSIWQEKMITSILSWKYGTGSIQDPTLDAIKVLSQLDSDYTQSLVDDAWEYDDWKVSGQLPISGKHVFSISRYPQESLEKEVLICLEDMNKRKDLKMLMSSDKLYELSLLWNKQGGKSLTPLEYSQNYIGKKEKVVIEELHEELVADLGTDEFWKNVMKGAAVWFKENIHSTSSWKRFSVAILKNDVTLKYLNFAPTSKERMARAEAISAFSSKEEERKKAKLEAERLAKKIEKENSQIQ